MKKKTFIVQLLDSKKPSRTSFTQVEDALFYSNDTDAYLVFLPHEQEGFEFNEATVALYNTNDESLVERPAVIETFEGRKSVVLKMTEDILAHWGRWQAQVVFKQGNKINTSVVVRFDTLRYMLDQRPPTLRDVIKLDELYSQLVTVMDEIAGKDVISAPEIILARGGENTLGERLDKEHNEVTAQLAQTDLKTLGIPLAPMSNVTVEENYTGILPLVFHDGWLYGFQNNQTIVRSNDDGGSWTTVATSPQGSLHSMYWTDDGEVLLGFNGSIRKSIGWSNNPHTATWKVVVTRSKGIGILPWGIDGDGTKFIVTEYSASDRSESRYVWISTDMGETFNVVVDKYDIDPDNTSHMHGVCYDRWADRFFLSHGHGIIEGVYWSDDDGATWNLVNADFELDASPTTLTATDNGIVAGSDSGRAGLYGIQRTENPHDMVMRRTARWHVSREGVTGFAYRGVRDEETGQVYVAIKSDFTDTSPVIMAGTATTGSLLWEDEIGSGSSFQFLAVTDKKVIGVHGIYEAYRLIVGDKPTLGVDVFDSGNVLVGKATSTSIGIGRNVDVQTRDEIVIGNNARQETGAGTDNVIIGRNASGGSQGVTIGLNSKSEAGFTTVIGNSAKASGLDSVAIGYTANTQSGGARAISIGYDADVSQPHGIAIGTSSKATGELATSVGGSASAGRRGVSLGVSAFTGNGNSVAIGSSARSTHLDSVALGADTDTNADNQLQIGQRHIELGVAPSGAGPIGVARIYLKENTDGKQELCVRFRNAEVVIATQP